jgi:hypothetical protein
MLDVRLLARPPGEHARSMVEGDEKEFVGGIEQLEQETIDRRARVLDALAEHAVADVEQHAQADRHALVRELRHGLFDAVLVHLERLAFQVEERMPLVIRDRRRDAGDLHTRLEGVLVADRRWRRCLRGRRRR